MADNPRRRRETMPGREHPDTLRPGALEPEDGADEHGEAEQPGQDAGDRGAAGPPGPGDRPGKTGNGDGRVERRRDG